MSEVVAVNINLDEDLQEFSRLLWRRGVSHRVIEADGRRLLLVGNPSVAEQVVALYQRWQSGDELPAIDLPKKPLAGKIASQLLIRLPVTLTLIVLSIAGALLVSFDHDFSVVKQLTFFDIEQVNRSVVFSIPEGQYWRLITPVFLHFGIMHIAFNMALLWFLGQRVELLQGSMRMLGISFLIALGSNIMQARYADLGIFGGMSGVVYGLLGYGWVWSILRPEKHLHIPPVLLYFSVFMMLLGFAGVIGSLGVGNIANVAHLGGLVMGLLIGVGAALIDKFSYSSPDQT